MGRGEVMLEDKEGPEERGSPEAGRGVQSVCSREGSECSPAAGACGRTGLGGTDRAARKEQREGGGGFHGERRHGLLPGRLNSHRLTNTMFSDS